MTKAVFLDRDGVINPVEVRDGKAYGPRAAKDFVLCPGVAEQVQRLKEAGYLVIVATNQPDVARGNMSRAELDRINELIGSATAVDDVLVCAHDDADACACRKPKPGLLLEAARRYDIDLKASYFVGDTWKDTAAAAAAGCRSVLIEAVYNEGAPRDVTVRSFAEAVDLILMEEN